MRYTTTLAFILLVHLAFSQNRIIEGVSNNNPTVAAILNPAYGPLSYSPAHILIGSGSMYIDNNYLFVERGPKSPLYHDDGKVDHTFMDFGKYRYDIDDLYTTEKKNGYVNARTGIASAVFLSGRTSYGLLIENRAVVEVANMSYHFAKHIFGGFEYTPLLDERFYHGEQYHAKIMDWTSIGLHFGQRSKSKFKKVLSYGVNAKFLIGHSQMTFIVDEIDYTVLDSVYMVTHRLDGQVYNSTDANYFNPGVALDFGFGFTKLKHGGADPAWALDTGYSCDPPNYAYRLGISV